MHTVVLSLCLLSYIVSHCKKNETNEVAIDMYINVLGQKCQLIYSNLLQLGDFFLRVFITIPQLQHDSKASLTADVRKKEGIISI